MELKIRQHRKCMLSQIVFQEKLKLLLCSRGLTLCLRRVVVDTGGGTEGGKWGTGALIEKLATNRSIEVTMEVFNDLQHIS